MYMYMNDIYIIIIKDYNYYFIIVLIYDYIPYILLGPTEEFRADKWGLRLDNAYIYLTDCQCTCRTTKLI